MAFKLTVKILIKKNTLYFLPIINTLNNAIRKKAVMNHLFEDEFLKRIF